MWIGSRVYEHSGGIELRWDTAVVAILHTIPYKSTIHCTVQHYCSTTLLCTILYYTTAHYTTLYTTVPPAMIVESDDDALAVLSSDTTETGSVAHMMEPKRK